MINIGARSGSQIIPYSGATKRTKEVNLTIGTVTTSAGNVSSPLVRRAVAVFYADSNGVWRMRFNVRITFTAITCTTVTVPVTGVLFKSQSGSFYQSTSGFFDIAAPIQCFAFANTANLYATLASTNISAVGFSGDVELESEPTAYTTADYMEGVVDASIYIPPADASTTGLLTHEAQTVGGVKTHEVGMVVNETGADSDTRIEGDTDANLLFVDASTDRIGIGTDTPLAKLHTYAAAGSVSTRAQSDGLADSGSVGHTVYGKKVGGSIRYAGVGVAKISANTEAAGYLNLSTQDGVETYFWQDDSDVFRLSSSFQHIGTSANGTIVGSQSSDRRLKDNIEPIGYGIDTVARLQPVQFDMFGKHQLGFIAQDIVGVVPESVYDTHIDIDGTDNTRLGMEYSQLIPILTKAIQEQQSIIDALKSRIEALENK